MTDRILSEEEAQHVNAGIAAERLLNDDTFQNAINALSDQLSTAIINTSLEDSNRRERLYMMHSCLVELIGILKGRVMTKMNIEQQINSENSETEV